MMKRSSRAIHVAMTVVLFFVLSGASAARGQPSVAQLAREILAEVPSQVCSDGDLAWVVHSELPTQSRAADTLAEALVAPLREKLRQEHRTGRFDDRGGFSESDEDRARETAAARGYENLVWIHLRTEQNFLEIKVHVWTQTQSAWRVFFRPQWNLLATAHRRTRIHAEIRSYLEPIPRAQARDIRVSTFSLEGKNYNALCSHDFDGDERAEILALTDDGLEVYSLRPSSDSATAPLLARIAARSLSHLDPSPTPRRRTVSACFSEEMGVFFESTLFHDAIFVSFVDDAFQIAAVPAPCGPQAQRIDGECVSLIPGWDRYRLAPSGLDVFAWRRASIVQADGTRNVLEVAIDADGRLISSLGSPVSLAQGAENEAQSGVFVHGTAMGIALAIADLEDDGEPEILASSSAAIGAADALSLFRIGGESPQRLQTVWQSRPTNGSVLVATRGDIDADGLIEFLTIEEPPLAAAFGAASKAKLWVVR